MKQMVVIGYKPIFIRQYKKLPKELQEEVDEVIGIFSMDPRSPALRVHKLKGKMVDFYSFSVNFQYRIVFEYEKKNSIILVSVGDHDVYR